MPDPTAPNEPYNLEPDAPPAPATPPSVPGAPPGTPKIAAEPLLAEFPPDADFTTDPELERAVAGPKKERPLRVVAETPEIVKPGLGDAKVWGIAGAVLTVGAIVATAVNTRDAWVIRSILVLYNVALHTGTGVVALYIAAFLSEKRVTQVEMVAARMLTAVAAFWLVANLRIAPWGETLKDWTFEELVLAAGLYLGFVAVLFRLPRREFLYVVGSHFTLWLVVELGMMLSSAAVVTGK